MADNITATEAVETKATENTQPEVSISDLQAQIERLTNDLARQKQATTAASADASKYKKELKDRMSEAERVESERAEAEQQLRTRLAELERSNAMQNYKNAYLAMGYSDDLAERKALAMTDGKIEEALSAEKDFIESLKQEYNISALRNMARPAAGVVDSTISVEDFNKMGYQQRAKLFEENPDLYNKLNNRG